ncbi:hypothetical protein FBU31_000906 [Coemansia sp. 'formosensis']|nr:hypothetical protein FBU31_000906 [Coemansia sp. 'formosensis']
MSMSQAQEGPPLPLPGTPAATDPEPESDPKPYEVPDEYKIVSPDDEAELKKKFPDMDYICGQPPERCSGANYTFEKGDKRVFRMTLSKLVREEEEWMLRELRHYVKSLTFLSYEATRAMLLHLQICFEKGPDAALPKIDYRYVSQFFRELRDQNCSGQEIENEVANEHGNDDADNETSEHVEASNGSSSEHGNDGGDTPADTRKSGDIDKDVKETLKLYKGTYNESGYNGFGRRYETMTALINYIVIDYLGDLKTHVEKNAFVVLKRYIVYDLTKDNVDYVAKQRRQRTKKDGYARCNGGGGQTKQHKLARRERRRQYVAAGNVPHKKAVERANSVLTKVNNAKTEKCRNEDWAKYGTAISVAKSIEQRLRLIYDLNTKLRVAEKSTVMLIPLYSASAKYITVDTTCLFDILMERERHNDNSRCEKGCERCKDRAPFTRSDTNKERFRWNRMEHWLKFFKIPEKLLIAKTERPTENKAYFNTMIMTDGYGTSLSTFRWRQKALPESSPDAPTTPSDPSVAEPSSEPSTSVPSTSALPAPARKRGRSQKTATAPESVASNPPISAPSASTSTVAAQLPTETNVSSTAGVKRNRTSKAAVKIGRRRVVSHVPSPAPVRVPGPEPPPLPVPATEPEPMEVDAPINPPAYTKKDINAAHARAMAEFAANPSDKVLPANPSSEAIEALHAAIPANFDDILADLRVSNADAIALHVKSKADAYEAATMDRAEYLREHERAIVRDKYIKVATLAYEAALREAEEHNEDLETARRIAKEVAERGVHVAECVAINAIDAKARKAADIYAELLHPDHEYIGGDPGKKTVLSLAKLGDPKWSCEFSAKQYHEDSGSTWRASYMNQQIDRLGLREWMSKTPTSKTVSSDETLELLRYLFKTKDFDAYMQMHQKPKVRKVRWCKYEQTQRTIAKMCGMITKSHKREKTTFCIGDAEMNNMRGCMPSPRVKKFTDYLVRTGWSIIMVRETNTSQVCSSCMMRLQDDQVPVRLCDVGSNRDPFRCQGRPSNRHFVRRCTACGVMWNRDYNAARNIAYLGMLQCLGLPRPWFFSKHLEDPPLCPSAIVCYTDPNDAELAVLPRELTPTLKETLVPVYRTPRVRCERPSATPTEPTRPAAAAPKATCKPPRKSHEERPRTMPAAARAARAREAAAKAAAKATEVAEALRVNPEANQPSERAVNRAEVNAKRIARERELIADIQKSACG